MNPTNYVETQPLHIKTTPQISEKTIQDLIVNKPSILGIGDYYALDRERIQFRGGRLDILLKSVEESNKRICTEIQLGVLDASHLFRAWEYYLSEKQKYPQYDVSAVLVCEEISDRILPVVRDLFSNKPFTILLMKAFSYGNNWGLQFIKYFDGVPLGMDEEDEEVFEKADRKYWIDLKGSAIEIVDDMLKLIKKVAPDYNLNYNKSYIGLANHIGSNNFVYFKLGKKDLTVCFKLDETETSQSIIDSGTFTFIHYKWKSYRIKINKNQIEENKEKLMELITLAYNENN
jgi:hypothetical protein